MLLFLVTSISFLFFMKFLCPKPLPSWATQIPLYFPKILFFSPTKSTFFPDSSMDQAIPSEKIEMLGGNSQSSSLLVLPDHVLDSILEMLCPLELCITSVVCSSLRERSNHVLERHLKQKWGRVLGPAAYTQWRFFIASSKGKFGVPERLLNHGLIKLWPFSQIRSEHENTSTRKRNWLPFGSEMSLFVALESGKFWLPAQVYNRETGHVGFMMSCYDAQLRYDSQTDTFQARYPPHGKKAVAIETHIDWERVRAPPIDTPPHQLHISDCLNDLRPGDHIEIQWRRNKDFPYGWWYGVVAHLESCDGNEIYCHCHNSDTVVLEFKQYTKGSRWRWATICRKDHREERNQVDGFYGGIRKLLNQKEIATWKSIWPKDILE